MGKRLTFEEVRRFVEDKGCKLISDTYVNNTVPLEIQCVCGEYFLRKYNTFKDSNSYYCNKCSKVKSEGEIIIENILKAKEVKYISQHRFDDCSFKRKLPFDFYLPNENTLIEFDGEQHYKIKECFGGYDEFVNTKIRDTIKNIYCKNNNINLIRVPYWELNNVKDILDKLIPR